MNKEDAEFSPVENCGGLIKFVIKEQNGSKQYSISYSNKSYYPAAMYGVYALVPQGYPISTFTMGGIGVAFEPPMPEGCIPVFMLSDREGMFGRKCPSCDGYFRQRGMIVGCNAYCPYCGTHCEPHHFLTESHLKYIQNYVAIFSAAFDSSIDAEIDMHKCAENVTADQKTEYIYKEERQQTRIECQNCRCVIDIIGQYGNCPSCNRRNTLDVLVAALANLEERVDNPRYTEEQRPQREQEWREITKQCVSVFEGFARDILAQLITIPMTKSRRKSVSELSLHNPDQLSIRLKEYFDIDMFRGVSMDEQSFINKKFLRRHVYEHNSGIADGEYIEKSKDSVRLGQLLKEKSAHVKTLINLIRKIAENINEGVVSIT